MDVLERTATQVRLPDGPIHRVRDTEQNRDGRVYFTCCGEVMSNVRGAMLTTHNPTCKVCWSGTWELGGAR
jgi:hypothetical protein